MSSLRQKIKETALELEEDIEAPNGDGKANEPTTSSFFAPSGRSSYNPIFLAKLVSQKVITLLVSSDEEDTTQTGRFVNFLKEIIVGLIIGSMIIFTLIFLDHRNVIHLQSAHNARNAAFQLLTDPETIANIEESTDLKIMPMAEYESTKNKIESATNELKQQEQRLTGHTKEEEEKRKEIESIKDEYEKLTNNPLLGLDKYCGECIWAGRVTCDARLQYMQGTHGLKPFGAKMSVMEVPTCKKS